MIWRHDEMTNHVQLKCCVDMAMMHDMGVLLGDADVGRRMLETRPESAGVSEIHADVGITRHGEVSFRMTFAPAIEFGVQAEEWVKLVCSGYMRVFAEVARGCN